MKMLMLVVIKINMLKIISILLYLNYITGESIHPACQFYKEQYEIARQDYDNLYNTGYSLYYGCIEELDDCNERLMDEMEVSDMYMQRISKSEKRIANVTGRSINSEREALIKENLSLQSTLQTLNKTLTKKVNRLEERMNISYTLIDEYKQNYTQLQKKADSLVRELHMSTLDVKNCEEKLENTINEITKQQEHRNKLVENINNCIEREEECQEKRNKYSLSLSACRKSRRKLKEGKRQ